MASRRNCLFCEIGICRKSDGCGKYPARNPLVSELSRRQKENVKPNGPASSPASRPHASNGSESSGSRANTPGSAGTETKQIACSDFIKGRCQYGDKCRYSHTLSNAETRKPHSARPDNNSQAQFRSWRYNIPADTSRAPKLGPSAGRFWQQTLELVTGDSETMQEVIVHLAGEGGLLRIKELLDLPFDDMGQERLEWIVAAQLLPFFKIITHEGVNASIFLENRVSTLYNLLFGSGGQRGVKVFQAVQRHLKARQLASSLNDGSTDEESIISFTVIVTAMAKMIEVNTSAQVNKSLPPIIEALSGMLDNAPTSMGYWTRKAYRCIERMKKQLGMGTALPSSNNKSTVTSDQPTFKLIKEMPGNLSENGARHDNDHADIRSITILPTQEEIHSPRLEYLPIADPSEWHLDGLAGLLDRNFRLLREDTVGPLRDRVSEELEALRLATALGQTLPAAEKRNRERTSTRTHVYTNVNIASIASDAFGGMEFALDFAQPEQLQGLMTEARRKEWWELSNRLITDALVCLLGSDGSATFFVVAPVATRSLSRRSDDQIKVAEIHKKHNLWNDDERARVILRLVRKEDTRPLLRRIMTIRGIRLSLVEFPGVLLPAFQPTLQAMQQMSTSLDMPFASYLAPQPTTASAEKRREIDPPAYAMKPGFAFDLSCITNPAMTFSIGDDVQDAVFRLEKDSSLDSAQARAFIMSLSRSLALIQGPPGTGKSYTGAALIETLLRNQKAADLGPIICVTFTNHALDQGLERLLDAGVSQIIRIGSRSKSERLANLTLTAVSRQILPTRAERRDRAAAQSRMVAETGEINQLLSRINEPTNAKILSEYLAENHPDHYEQIFID